MQMRILLILATGLILLKMWEVDEEMCRHCILAIVVGGFVRTLFNRR